MIIRILPSLRNRKEWIDFCSRKKPYCYVEDPSTLVDFQSTNLIITLTPNGLRDGRQAIKYSIGSPQTIKPAWDFIKGCRFDLAYMIDGLETIDFASNARDNHYLGFCPEANVRKFFNKESAIISPETLGILSPLTQPPNNWAPSHILRLLANGQYSDFRSEKTHLKTEPLINDQADYLLIKLIETQSQWQIKTGHQRLWIVQGETPRYSFIPVIAVNGKGLSLEEYSQANKAIS